MENYQILTLNSGQPLILYQENEKVYMYTVYSGRIQSHGVIFDDLSDQLFLHPGEVNYVSYISTHGRLRLYQLKDMRFLELLSLSNDAGEHREFLQCRLHAFHSKIFLFYKIFLQKAPEGQKKNRQQKHGTFSGDRIPIVPFIEFLYITGFFSKKYFHQQMKT